MNAVANLTNVLRMKRLHSIYVTNFHNTHCGHFFLFISASLCPMSLFAFKFVLIVEFYENAIQMLANLNKRLTTTTNALPTIRLACDWLQLCCEWLKYVGNMIYLRILGACF